METLSLYEQVVRATGLPAYIGPSAVRRALAAAACHKPEEAGPEDYLRALSELTARMRIYLAQAEVERRAAEIKVLLDARPREPSK